MLQKSAGGHAQHASYAPYAVEELVYKDKGYDYWALGHVHAQEILGRSPWVVFPGNARGRHSRESGPKGCVVVTFEVDAVTEAATSSTVRASSPREASGPTSHASTAQCA